MARLSALPKQPRSQRTLEAILDAAYLQFNMRDVEAVSIADIAEAAGCSVGTIYTRFVSKEALFQTLIERCGADSIDQLDCALASLPAEPTPPQIVRGILVSIINVMHRDAVLIRSALRRSQSAPEIWTPLRLHGALISQRAVSLLRQADDDQSRLTEFRIGFAFQVVFGTLVNMIINDPGPLSLGSPNLADELTSATMAYLELRR